MTLYSDLDILIFRHIYSYYYSYYYYYYYYLFRRILKRDVYGLLDFGFIKDIFRVTFVSCKILEVT